MAGLARRAAGGRAGHARQARGKRDLWIAAERWPFARAVFADAVADPPVALPEKLDQAVERSTALVELVRGRVEHAGPTTAGRIAECFDLDAGSVFAALEALEGSGAVLRGSFGVEPVADATHANGTNGKAGERPAAEWCDRRLLARIHRLTLDGLRRQIQAAEPAAFFEFLARHHHLASETRWGGAVGVREAVAQLQGFELPAGAWESRVLAARVADYDPAWLDNLFLSGEVVWGRLNPPRRDADEKPSMAMLTRTVPISLVVREELAALLPSEREAPAAALRSGAARVLEVLAARGALFFGELKAACDLLPAQLEESLRELAALGLITSDAFAAVRKIADTQTPGTSRRRGARRALHGAAAPIGRWSLFPGPIAPNSPEAHREAWCRQLLRRYGVVFRDLLERESSAPAWQDLVGVLRRMELRGDVRGGRFVSQVSGEQYGLPAAVDRLREAREQVLAARGSDDWLVLSAADPLNLFGFVVPGPRVPATHRNALIVRRGRVVATRVAGVVEFHETVDAATAWEMRRAMTLGRRRATDEAEPTNVEASIQRNA